MDINSFFINKGYVAIPIQQNTAGLLLINVKINNIPGLFILDTGAGSTVIDSKQANHFQLILQTDSTTFTGAGAGGQGMAVTPSEGNRVEIENYVAADFPLLVMSLFEHVGQALTEAGAHEELFGVIGVDILKPGKAIVDFDTMTLYLYQGDAIANK